MNYEFTPQEKEIKEKVVAEKDETFLGDIERLESAEAAELKSLTSGLLKRLGSTGYLSTAQGKRGRSEINSLIPAMEEVSNLSGSLLLAAESSARLMGGLLADHGESPVLQDALAQLRSGELIGAVAISEPPDAPGGEPATTTAIKDGDHYLVSGVKSFVSNGPIADIFAVQALLEDKPAFFIIDADTDGLEKNPRRRTLGYHGLAVGGLTLKDVKVPSERIIGPFDNVGHMEHPVFMQDLALAAASLGVMFRAMYSAKNHAQSHVRDGKPVFYHQEVRFKFADMLTSYQTSQILTYRAAWHYSVDDADSRTLLNCAKVFAAEASEEVSALSMQVLAGAGYVMGNPVERAYRESKYAAIAGTTSERARMEIAEEQLRKYKV